MWDVNGGWMRTKLHTTVRRSTATRPSVVATRHLSRARMKPYRAHTPTSQCRPPGARLRDEDDAHQCACVIRLHRHSFQSCSLPPSLRSCAPRVHLCLQQPASARSPSLARTMKPYRAHTPTPQCRPPGARLRDEDDAHQCACVIRLHRHSFQSCSLPPSLRSCAPPVRLCLQQPASASCKVDSCHVVPGPGRNRSTSQVSTGLAQCVGVAQCVVS